MPAILVLLPLSTFAMLALLFYGQWGDSDWRYGWIGSILLAASFWGVISIAGAELLSLIELVNRPGLSLWWMIALLPLAVFGVRSGAFSKAVARAKDINVSLDRFELLILGSLALISAALFLIAVVAPPNNVDSFLYHMSRVVHWAQNESLEHYPAYIDHQLNKPIWAETAILHLRVLWGSDRPANLIQWFSMIGSVIGVAGIAGLIGANRRGQWVAAVFAMTIPMGILQATSTQNDYVTAFWTVCIAYLVVQSMQRPLSTVEFLGLACSFGLGVLTKGVFFVYFPPLLLWYFLYRLRRKGLLSTVASGTAMLAIALVLNLGFWARNVQTYGGPYGTSDWLQRNLGFNVDFLNRFFDSDGETSSSGVLQLQAAVNTNAGVEERLVNVGQIHAPVSGVGWSAVSSSSPTPQLGFLDGYLSQLARTVGRNLTSPFGFVTNRLISFVQRYPGIFGEGYGDQLKASAWNHEDHAGNLHHLLLIALMLILLPFVVRREREWLALLYGSVVAFTYLLLPIVIGHAESFWGIRYQLPFFVLAAPIPGYIFSRLDSRWMTAAMAGGLLIAALPWVLLNNSRPIIGMPPWPTRIESIFAADQEQILMANNPALRDDYQLTAAEIRSSGCKEVGFIVDQSFLEYPLWWLLEAPQSSIEIRIIVSQSDNYPSLAEDFQPCAVVCTHCGDSESMHGLSDRLRFDTLTLFR